MNFELFNDNSKILINDAQNKAISLNHQQVSTDHLVFSILEENNHFLTQIFEELDVDYSKLKEQIEFFLKAKPKIMGENINIFFSSDLIEVFEKSQKIKNEFDDDFISPEILLYTILSCEETEISNLLTKSGINKDKLKETIIKLRKGQTINSQSKSINSDSLKKFSTNLTELAKRDNLTPLLVERKKSEEVYRCSLEELKIIQF